MSDLLSIGASGVRAYQTALSVVGENIANSGTVGYSRRSVTTAEVAAGIGVAEKSTAGNGVRLTGITRASDDYAASAVRNAGADLARTETSATWLDRVQKALTGNQLTERVTGFFTATTALAAEPTSNALRSSMLSAADSAATAFAATAQSFDQMGQDIDTQAGQAITTLNSLSAGLTRINEGLGRTTPGTAAAAQLVDQRDQILEQMSAIVDVGVNTDALGRVTVSAGGQGGPTLVQGDFAATVRYSRTAGAVALSVSTRGGDPDAILVPNGGALAGLDEAADRMAGARSTLNTIATNFFTQMNAVQTAGQDLTNTQGTKLFVGDPVDPANPAAPLDPARFKVALTSGSQIAAATLGTDVRNGGNLTGYTTARTTGGFETGLTTLVNNAATAYKQKSVVADAQTAIRDGAANALSSATGVNVDSEAIDLMRFQQAYQASSRVIQVARDTFQSILEIR